VLERITWFRQSAFRWAGNGLTVYIDPWGVGDDAPPADVIFLTHAHYDHFVPDDIERISTGSTKIAAPHDVAAELSGDVTPVAPGESHEIGGVAFTTVPAYNIQEHRLASHPKENRWVGYVMELGGSSYYHAGDTDHAPELDDVRADVAFLPIGGGSATMDAAEAGGLARSIAPHLAVPMHYGFVAASPSEAERFRKEADPVKVEILTPVNAFEQP
jgi:L-ascorbate metabolism protein UlaG (beta-lactamase superfamily)